MDKQETIFNKDFNEIIKDAYMKCQNESELTLEKLLEDLKVDLKNLLIEY